jgi:hypothetical protein
MAEVLLERAKLIEERRQVRDSRASEASAPS